jgi:hypothetical protein
MKKRYSIIFTLTAAAVLVSSIAYASKKKLQPKPERLKQDMSEVDLAANLLETNVIRQVKPPKESYSKKRDDEELKDLTIIDISKSSDKTTER